jgi:superfamily II DNA or RNA helicase
MPEEISDILEPVGSGQNACLPESISLWQHQRDAVAKMRQYIVAFEQGATKGSALVHMPTGSGKTGVIAVLARCIPESQCILILTPRVALREQLVRDITARFFERLEVAPDRERLPKQIVELDGPFRDLKYENVDTTVFVSTIQKLQSMQRHNTAGFEHLRDHVSLVMFDEGHYEPALTWSRTIRQFLVPKIVFTATPYRNDLKVFDLDLQHAYSYTYSEAVDDGYLREVEVVPRESTEDPEVFIDDVLAFYDAQFASQQNQPRVIIRCEQRATIRQLAAVLQNRGRAYVAIHEGFSDVTGDTRERKTVPDPSTENAIFWIHQFKLLEGIDDSRFQVLALYEALRSARPLIQQIGRIIRNPSREPGAKGYVLDHSEGAQTELWEGFLRYDGAIRAQGATGLNLAVGQAWLAAFATVQPGLGYLDGRFRSPLDFDSLLPSDELLLPLRVNLLRKLEGFDLTAFCDLVEQEYEEQDRLVNRYLEGEETAVLVYISFANSPYLRTMSYIETKLGVTVIRELGNMVAFFDSLGYVPLNNDEARLGKAIAADGLKRLFCGHESYLTHVSLRNSNLGARAIRTRAISAANVQETVCAFDDHAQICTTATGYSDDDSDTQAESRRRYVGFHRGRISEGSGQWGSLGEYLEWLDYISDRIQGSKSSLTTFRRYAPEEVAVEDPTPEHILLDLFEVEENYVTLGSDAVAGGMVMQIDELSCEVQGGEFTLVANGIKCKVHIAYDAGGNRYRLESADLERLYRNTRPKDNRSVIDYLNQEQSFRVIPRTSGVIYVLGEFYRPIFQVGPGFNPLEFEVSKILIPSATLEAIDSEKGESFPSDQSGWDPASLFGILDDRGSTAGLGEYFGNPDIVVCDDMRTEVADFILAEIDQKRAIFVHAKASSKRRPYSASALQEVCAQATKNINYLGMFNEAQPPNLSSWQGCWPDDQNPRVAERIRCGPSSATEAWSEIQSIVHHPWADRQVWLFLGQILSKSEFEAHLGRDLPTPEAVQAAFLLHATMTSVASVGAKLRVFCCP